MKASDPVKFVPKGWGYEKWIANCPEYCGKLLFFVKGKKCSWHYHEIRTRCSIFILVRQLVFGRDDDILKAEKQILIQGDKFHVPRGLRHQMFALKDTELFEFSTQHFDDDSYRILKGD